MSVSRWKKARGETLWHKLNREREYQKFGRLDKAIILGLVMVAIILLPSFSYYQLNVAPYQPGGSQYHNPDPWYTLWNGQTPLGTSSSRSIVTWNSADTGIATGGLSFAQNLTVNGMSFNQGDLIIAEIFEAGGYCPGCFTVKDNHGFLFTFLTDSRAPQFPTSTNPPVEVWTFIAGSGMTAVLAGAKPARNFGLLVTGYKNVDHIGNVVPSTSGTFTTGSKCSPCSTLTNTPSIVTHDQSMIVQMADEYAQNLDTSCGTRAYNNGQTERIFGANCSILQGYSADLGPSLVSGSQNMGITATSNNSGGDLAIVTVLIELIPKLNDCTTAYVCNNAFIETGDVILAPNSTFPGVAISTSAVDLSTGAGKSIAFSQDLDAAVRPMAGLEQFAWFLRTNGTIPLTQNWNPLFDSNVVLAVYAVVESCGTSGLGTKFCQISYYVYVQRQVGQQLAISTAGPSTGVFDPYPLIGTCPSLQTIFMCYGNANVTQNGSNFAALALNFTAGVTGTTSGASYLCNGSQNQLGTVCSLGGADNSQITINNVPQPLKFLFPWMSLQNQYYSGFWESNDYGFTGRSPESEFISGQGSLANVISVFVPSGSGTTDTGGFFGWVGRALGGAYNTVAGVLAPIVNPVLNLGNSLMNAFISALIQAFSLIASGLVITLNAIGGIFGNPALGTQIASLFTNIANFLTNVFGLGIAQIANAVSFLIQGLLFLALLLGPNGFLAGIIFVIGVLYSVLLLILNILANISTGLGIVAFLDWLYFGMSVYFRGVRGASGWANLNIYLMTFLFKAIYWLIKESIWLIKSAKQMLTGWI